MSRSLIIIGSVLAGAALFAHRLWDKAERFSENLDFQLKAIGKTRFLGRGKIEVPVFLELINPENFGVTVSNMLVQMSVMDKGKRREVGRIMRTAKFEVQPKTSTTVDFKPVIDLNALDPFRENRLQNIIENIFSNGKLATFYIETTAVVDGIAVGPITQKREINVFG